MRIGTRLAVCGACVLIILRMVGRRGASRKRGLGFSAQSFQDGGVGSGIAALEASPMNMKPKHILPLLLAALLFFFVLGVVGLAGSSLSPPSQHVQQVIPDDRISR